MEIDLPNAQAAMSAYYVLGPCEAFSNLARFDSIRYGYMDPGHSNMDDQYDFSRAKGFGEEARRRIMLGSYLLSAGVYDKYYYPAQQVRTLITQDYASAFEKPVGLGSDTGLPVGVQLISPAFKDENMLKVAAALERQYGIAKVAPAFCADAKKGGE